MSRYINREEALSFPFANGQYDHKNADENFILGCESYKEWLENLQTADVIPVVRCKDCKYYHEYQVMNCSYHASSVCENWFCSQGRVKKDG